MTNSPHFKDESFIALGPTIETIHSLAKTHPLPFAIWCYIGTYADSTRPFPTVSSLMNEFSLTRAETENALDFLMKRTLISAKE